MPTTFQGITHGGNVTDVMGRNRTTFVADMIDRRIGRLWDSIDFPSGPVCDQHFFQIPIGDIGTNGFVKTGFDTNMQRSFQLLPPRCFLTQRIIFTFSKSCLPEDVGAAFDSLMFRFVVADKCFASSPICHMRTLKEPLSPIRICEFCRSVFVEAMQCPGCGARSFKLSSLSECDPGQQFVMDLESKYIPPCTDFRIELRTRPTMAFRAPVRLWCHFEGFEDLPVE